jgi:hypothetical protein
MARRRRGSSETIKYGDELGSASHKSCQYIWRICGICGTGKWVRKDAYRKICKTCSRQITHSHPKPEERGVNNPNWKGGSVITQQGYKLVHIYPDSPFYSMAKQKSGYVLEHRLVMAKKLGRPLAPSEKVHHIDGNRSHNDDTNLELTTQPQHKLSYQDGYKQGFKDGQKARIQPLEKQIRLLRFQVHELLQAKMEV